MKRIDDTEGRFCNRCKQYKTREHFYVDKNGRLLNKCIDCKKIVHKDDWYNKCSCGNRKTKKSDKCQVCTRLPYDQIKSRDAIRKTIIRDNLIPYECQECGNTGEYNGQPLALHLDHINGIKNDHTLSNLRFLCPNCHSQTDTYCGRNIGSYS